jgi:hypothetical protein
LEAFSSRYNSARGVSFIGEETRVDETDARSGRMTNDILGLRNSPSAAPELLRDALAYWEGKLGGRRMPARRDLDPVLEIPRLLPWIILVDVLRDPVDFRYRVIGTGVVDRTRRNYTGACLSELTHVERDGPLWTDRIAAIETRAPRLTAPSYTGRDKTVQGVSGVHLPLSNDGESVDMILTFVAYRTN